MPVPYTNTVRDEDMPLPDRVVVYGSKPGHPSPWCAPAMFHYATEGCDLRAIAAGCGFDALFVAMSEEIDDNHPLMRAYEDGEDAAKVALAWQPKPREGWNFSGMADTEDGLVATFLKPREEGNGNG